MVEGVTINLDRTPWASAVSYWHPPTIVLSSWLEHAPFAYWLMSALQPRTVVELGTHNGYSFFVLCEAAKRLGLNARLWAVDTWRGDDHAGFYGDEVFSGVQEVVDADYAQSAVLLRGYFADFVDDFEDGSIELLHIDGRHAYDDVREDFESWLPKVAEHGVVLFHDIAVSERGFGVQQFFGELAERHATFGFLHNNGLGVLSVGSPAPGLAALFDASDDEVARIRQFYAERGATITAEWNQREWIGDHYRAQLAEIHSSTSWRLTRPVRAIGKLRRR
jgi:predicted O-methyltransferase YrrM